MHYPRKDVKAQVFDTRMGPLLGEEHVRAVGHVVVAGLRAALSAWGLLVGGYIANNVGAAQGALLLLAGCSIGAALASAGALPCNRYGLAPTDAAAPSLGVRGAKALLFLFALNHVAWAGLMLTMFGRGVQNFLSALGIVRGNGVVTLMVVLGIAVIFGGVVKGSNRLPRMQALAMPSLVMIGSIVMLTILHDISWQDLMGIPPLSPQADAGLRTLGAFECALGVGLAWWPDAARLSRGAHGQRTGFYVPCLTLALTTAAMGTAGMCAALLLRSYDPTQWLVFLGGRAFGALTLVVIIITNLVVVARMMRTALSEMLHVACLRAQGRHRCAALLFAPLFAFATYPNALYERGDAIITINGYILAPICCVMVIDHMLLRQQRLDVSQVLETGPQGHYWFTFGFNPWAWLAVSLGVATAWGLYNPFTCVAHPWSGMAGATLPAAATAASAYLGLHYIARRCSSRRS